MTYPMDAGQRRSDSGEFISKSRVTRVPQRGPLPRTRNLSRPYNVAWLTSAGDVAYDTIVAPSVPVIESACANLARGALVSTTVGPVAVEDLVPGMDVLTSEYRSSASEMGRLLRDVAP